MPTTNLKNITIKEKQDKNLNPYYLIVDKDTNNAYFCFSGAVKSGWEDLVNDYQNICEVELEFETNERGNNKVVTSQDKEQEQELKDELEGDNKSSGTEINGKKRPIVVISNNFYNEKSSRIASLPLPSKVKNIRIFELFLGKVVINDPKNRESKVMIDQIRVIDKAKLREKGANLPHKDKLKSLNLFGNEIKEIDFTKIFTNFPKLEKINLSGNPLSAKNLDDLSSEQFAKLIKGIKEKKISVNSFKGTVLMDLLEYAQKLAGQGNQQQQQNAQYLQALIQQGGSPVKSEDSKRPGNNTPLLVGGLAVFGLVAVTVGYLWGKRRKINENYLQ
ncbi:14315_t:CDS:2 [Cetraspora pellucida]|uniref:14315_t:CDS:1 n=1 Tax=Cetraspora pellucida TaxID=1433469 RepID=A0ACA9KG72_9GLOM|nr:14315_t:CDS:2 [Cetraspora pellucida]